MVPFGGWEMPLEYPTGTIAEHLACRRAAVVFDVSHLGTVRVGGTGALERLQSALCNDLTKIGPGRAQYTHLLDESDASVLDDIIVWWHPRDEGEPDAFDVMPNASNTDRVRAAIAGEETTHGRAVLAVQGPDALDRLAGVFPEAAAVKRFRVAAASWTGTACTVAGTGYTGERGVEIAVPAEAAVDAVVGGRRRRHPAGRPRCPRHAAPRGGIAAARQRARPGHHPAAGGPRLGRGVGQGRFPRARCARRRTGTGRAPPPRRHRHGGAAPAAAPGAPCSSTAIRSGRSRAGTSRQCSGTASPWRSSRRRWGRGPPSRSTCAAPVSRPRSCPRRS